MQGAYGVLRGGGFMTFSVHRLMWSSYGHGFSYNLRRLRHGRGLSQQALADIAGLSRNQISNLERNENGARGVTDPQLSTVYRLALALEVPPAALLPAVASTVEEVCSPVCAADANSALISCVADVRPFPNAYIESKRFAAKPWG